MRPWQVIPTVLVPLVFSVALPASAQDRPFHPSGPGREARYDGWESDGAPRPPRMWRGHGGTMWTDHYRACRKAYGSRYDYRTDTVRRGGSRRRCAL